MPSELTKEELRIACAEAMGLNPWRWKFQYQHEEVWDESRLYDTLEEAQNEWRDWYDGPTHASPIEQAAFTKAYDSDLNACAELRASLTEEEQKTYASLLWKAASESNEPWPVAIRNISAEQDCMCILAAKTANPENQ